MEWNRLLCSERLRRLGFTEDDNGRSPYQKDIDRIIFSAPFRRLANKTQVHLLSSNDHVHTRLTHSIEVASVGRSLGTLVGKEIVAGMNEPGISPDDFGCIVQAACLAHDIGNPPFGHAGEEAIRSWFLAESATKGKATAQDRPEDLQGFEGNAQGFRILTQIENNKWDGGLQLTHAVLGSFTKYPRASNVAVSLTEEWPWARKSGFFKPEEPYFREIAKSVGLVQNKSGAAHWCRHPLAFLVEAADDICYSIIDIEDGYELRDLSFTDAKSILASIGGDVWITPSMTEAEQIAKLRADAINNLVRECAQVFLENQTDLMNGTFRYEITKISRYKDGLQQAQDFALEKLFRSERNTMLEVAGSAIIEGLLRIFAQLVTDLENRNFDQDKLSRKSQRLARLIGDGFRRVESRYDAFLCITDFISGMTDRFAVALFRRLTGVST
jgi:dGTPase